MSNYCHKTKHSNDLIRYLPDGNVQILWDNILTRNKIVHKEIPLLKIEGRHIDVIKVLDVFHEDGIVYLQVQDQGSGRVYNISHVLIPAIEYFVWYLIDLDYILKILEEKIMMELIVGKTTSD